jgi:hypothetical protein
VYHRAPDITCSDTDLITYLVDCENAFNEIALDGYTFGGEVDYENFD